MREILLYLVVAPFVLWWSYRGFAAALALYRQDRKERLALALGRNSAPFARAYSTVRALGGTIPSCAPWHRAENGGER